LKRRLFWIRTVPLPMSNLGDTYLKIRPQTRSQKGLSAISCNFSQIKKRRNIKKKLALWIKNNLPTPLLSLGIQIMNRSNA